jgi:hypothetical protein
MFNTIIGAGAVGAGAVGAGARAASRYDSGSGSDQKMRLLAAPAPAPKHCTKMICLRPPPQKWLDSFIIQLLPINHIDIPN